MIKLFYVLVLSEIYQWAYILWGIECPKNFVKNDFDIMLEVSFKSHLTLQNQFIR